MKEREDQMQVEADETVHLPAWLGTSLGISRSEARRIIATGGFHIDGETDRYGIGKRGEQYQGWKQLSAGDSDLEQRGRELIAEHGGSTAALKATHPDLGGDPDDFRAVQAAREGAPQ